MFLSVQIFVDYFEELMDSNSGTINSSCEETSELPLHKNMDFEQKLELLEKSYGTLKKWHKESRENRFDFSNTIFEEGYDFSEKYLKECVFVNTYLRKAKFKGKDLANFDFEKADLCYSNLEGASLVDVTSIKEAKLFGANLTNANLTNVDLSGIDLRYAKLNGAILTDTILDNCDIRNTKFKNATICSTSLNHCKGINLAKGLDKTLVTTSPKNFNPEKISILDKISNWEKISTMGKLPLFGVSYFFLACIPLYLALIKYLNNNVLKVKSFLSNASLAFENQIISTLLNDLASKIDFFTYPEKPLLMLFFTVSLALATTIYTFFCPSRIKNFSKDEWIYLLNKEPIHYWSLSWKYKYLRYICGFLYIIGGGGWLYLIFKKIWEVTCALIIA